MFSGGKEIYLHISVFLVKTEVVALTLEHLNGLGERSNPLLLGGAAALLGG